MSFKADFALTISSADSDVHSNLKVGQTLQLQTPEGTHDVLCATLDGATVGAVPGGLARTLRHRQGLKLYIKTLKRGADHPGGVYVEVRATAGSVAAPTGGHVLLLPFPLLLCGTTELQLCCDAWRHSMLRAWCWTAGQPNKLSALDGPPTDDPAGYVVKPSELERLGMRCRVGAAELWQWQLEQQK
jgi:hypothetical protein